MINELEVTLAKELAVPIIKEYLIPKLKSVIKKYSLKDFNSKPIEENFETYLSKRYEKFSFIETLAFPNMQTLFVDLYEPLFITNIFDTEYYDEEIDKYIYENKRKDQNEILIEIDKYPDNFIPEFERVIIEDTAGMGKSTISKRLFLSIIEQNKGVPILIELRQINNKNNFLKEIQNQLSPIGKKISQDFILKLLDEGEFIFLLDGFDEISLKDKSFVIKELHKFIEKANRNYFLITSRMEDSLTSFGDFKKFRIKPLTKIKAFSLIRRYDKYSYKHIAHELINKLEDGKQISLREFLTNPFLVSLLFKSFDHKKDIPVKKTQFYNQVFDALFETHDLSKEGYLVRDKYSNLPIDDFERVLRYVAFYTTKENKVEYDKNYIINIISKAKKNLSYLRFKENDFLKDLIETVPLFKKEGLFYKWSHKSFQDYFSAKYLWIDAKEDQENILKGIYLDNDNKRCLNLLELFWELDPLTFDLTILYWLLSDFRVFAESVSKQSENISNQLINQRVENSYNKKCFIVIISKYRDYEYDEPDFTKYKFYDEKLSKFFKYYEIRFTYNLKDNNSSLMCYISSIFPHKESILQLLKKRDSNLMISPGNFFELNKINLLQKNCIYEVNSDQNNILNDPKIYDNITKIITNGFRLNYDLAFKRLNEIEKIIKKKSDDELGSW